MSATLDPGMLSYYLGQNANIAAPVVLASLDPALLTFFLTGGISVTPPVTTSGIPPLYAVAFLNLQDDYKAGKSYSFLFDITDQNGGLVPVPASTLTLLDANQNALSPPVSASPVYDNNTIAAYTQTVGGILTMPEVTAPSQVFWVYLQPTLNDGTGVQTPPGLAIIRVLP